ncbi:MAG: YutD family protein [Gammaproteobacteria bacterium]|nr:YutD family protein [Gammaproteobacteria bacterium]
MVETNKGLFEIIKDDKKVFVINEFEDKFVEYLTKYEYIVGDYSNNILRLKGFDKKNAKFIPDYINEFCALDQQYYILRNPNFNKDYKDEEDEQ